MKKLICVVLFLMLFGFSFAIEREETLKKARELSWDKKFEKSEKLYEDLIGEYKDLEIVLAYSDLLAWMGQYKKAVLFLKGNAFEDDMYYLQLAKIYYWKKDYKKANDIYKKTDKTDQFRVSFENWYDNYKKYEIKYKYSSEFISLDREEIPAFYLIYDHYSKFALVFSKEYFYRREEIYEAENKIEKSNLRNVIDLMELYYKKWYFAFGKSDYWDRQISIEYTYKFLTLGIKDIDGFLTYKLRTDNYIKDFIFSNEINIPEKGDNYYETELVYKKIKYTHTYDLKDLNRSEIKYEKKYKDYLIFDIGLFRSYNQDRNGYIIETAYKF